MELGIRLTFVKTSEFRGMGELFFGGGVQQIQLRPEGRENGDLRAVAP
jgi:hypothetical protein